MTEKRQWVHKLNLPRFAAAGIGVFALTFFFDYIVHGIMLKPMYGDTPGLWRDAADMQLLLPWTLVHHLLLAYVIVFLFTLNYQARGWMEGVRFGLVMGTIFALIQTASFAWLPVALPLALSWGAAELVRAVLSGIMIALIYQD